jgi:pimeloyl-ACP methyl ester carboxylesterase
MFDPRPDYPLLITAKRYWRPPESSLSLDPLTIIFAHGNGFHKKKWEPTIDELYVLLDKAGIDKIRDVWSIDIPNHGDAAILNEQTLVVHQPVCMLFLNS